MAQCRLVDDLPSIQVKESSLLTSVLRNLYPNELSAGFEETSIEKGIYGAMNLDTTGRFIPSMVLSENGKKLRKSQSGCAYLSNLSVLPVFQRHGIGTTLLKEAEQLAFEWGCWGASLHCSPKNTHAYRLYLKLGYEPVEGAPADRNQCVFLAKVF